MTTALTTFAFGPQDNSTPPMALRTIHKDGQPWFVAKDVCTALGYTNTTEALNKHVDDDDRNLTNCETPGGIQTLNAVNESGLYSLILRSHKPEAKAFRKWVVSVVLPAIRKDGSYVMGEEKVVTGEMSEDELIAKALTAVAAKADRRVNRPGFRGGRLV